MSDFVRMHLLKQLNYRNPMTRLDNLESGKIQPSATVAKMSDLSSNMGEVITGKFNFYNPTTGQLVGYLTSTPDPAYPNYYMVALDASGNVQFSVDPSTSGATTMGNGAVTINESGVILVNGLAALIMKDTSGSLANILIQSTTDNNLLIYNQVVGGDIDQLIELTDGTGVFNTWHENESLANQSVLTLDAGAAGLRAAFGTDHYIDALNPSGTGSATVYFNERNKDIDFNVQGQTDNYLIYADASTDNVGIGTNTPASKLDVAGSFQCNSITNDTGLAHGTWTPTATAGTNVAASTDITPNISNYIRVGNQVFFNGSVTIDTTAIGAFTCYLTVPIASNFNSNFDANGNGTQPGTGVPNIFSIREDQVNDRLQLDGYSQTAAAVFYRFAGGYIVK